MATICPHCHISILKPHPENNSIKFKDYVKCGLCGFATLRINYIMNDFSITFEDTAPIRKFEGFSLSAYPDPVTKGDPWTIAWGLTGSWVKKDLVLTEEEAKQKFMEEINKYINRLKNMVFVELSKNQFIAILSLSWNIGLGNFQSSTLLKKLNKKDFPGASLEFSKWNKAQGRVIPGLVKRREEETKIFLTP